MATNKHEKLYVVFNISALVGYGHLPPGEHVETANMITIVSVWGTSDEAENEVVRLTALNGPFYFWQVAKNRLNDAR